MSTSQREACLALRWEWALRDNPPTGPLWDKMTFLTAMALHAYASPEGFDIFPTLKQLAAQTCASTRTLSEARKRLVDLGLIALVTPARTDFAPVYRLVDPQLWQHAEAATPDMVADVVEMVAEVQSPSLTVEDWDPYSPDCQPSDFQPWRDRGGFGSSWRSYERRQGHRSRADI